jgi:predicted transposase/invertase (TIGR01784 family)
VYSQNSLPKELAAIESIKKASEKLEVMYLNEKERQYYEAQQKRYLDENSRIQEAVEEAELKKQLEMAKNAIKKGFDNQIISELTDLTVEQIEQLRHKKQ